MFIAYAKKLGAPEVDAEDAVSQALQEVWQKASSTPGDCRALAFTLRLIRLRVIDLLRSRRRQRLTALSAGIEDPDDLFDHLYQREWLAVRRSELAKAISHLDEVNRQVMRMLISGLTESEIARRLHLSPQRVNQRKQSAFKRVAAELSH